MKNLTTVSLSLIAWVFLFQITSAQTVNRNAWNIGITSGIGNMGGNKEHDVKSYYHVGLNLGFFPAADFAFGFELDINSIHFDDGPYPAYGLGAFIRFNFEKNFSLGTSYDVGPAGDDADFYNKLTFSLGYALFLSKSIALEPTVFYVFHNEAGSSRDFNGPGIGLGIQSFLNRK